MPKTTNATANPVNTTQLSCGCVVASPPGAGMPSCPRGHTQDTPDHRRRWC
jgi:hypothetical protein